MAENQDLINGLSLSPAIMTRFRFSIPDHRMDQRRGEGFWTIKEHLAHLADVQVMLDERLVRFAKESRPVFIPHFPSDVEGNRLPVNLSPAELVDLFRQRREDQLVTIRAYPESVWEREAEHPEYIEYTALILVRHILAHDFWHLYRMEELWLTRDGFLTT